MDSQVSRLSALPKFLRGTGFWGGVLNPRERLRSDRSVEELRIMAASHRWGIISTLEPSVVPTRHQFEVIQIAQGLLERGIWTLPSWRIEGHLGSICEEEPGWIVKADEAGSSNLSIDVTNDSPHELFPHLLVTGRLPGEGAIDVEAMWEMVPSDIRGSDLERRFLEQVAAPELGLPLVDFLALQPTAEQMGLDPSQFGGQRLDFALYTGRRHRLVIEVDGNQHQDAAQSAHDRKRDAALKNLGWDVWRIPAKSLDDARSLRKELRTRVDKVAWGSRFRESEIRPRKLLALTWGATISARIQFMVLEAMGKGHVPWAGPIKLSIIEGDTSIGRESLEDLADWFGRLRLLHGEAPFGEIEIVRKDGQPDLVIDINATNPYARPTDGPAPIAWSRPANMPAPPPSRRFGGAVNGFVPLAPSEPILTRFVQDILRKRSLREGQFEILSRILQGKDVVGLLPTGGGKSLTYQLAGLLLGGVTLYVSPLKSLLQDQRERLRDLGIDQVEEISSALTASQKTAAGLRLAAGGVRFLLISPERFLIPGFRDILSRYRAMTGEVSQVVVDECHCVSEWGHEFRPAYLSLSRIARDRTNRLGITAPIIALTGTASTIVLADVQRELGILERDAVIRAKSLERRELSLKVVSTPQSGKSRLLKTAVLEFETSHPDHLEGHLIFTRFIGGTDGVLGISADLQSILPRDGGVRFFCGEEPNWKNYAAFCLREKAVLLTPDKIQSCIPQWVVDVGTDDSWEKTKSRVQTDYISGLKDSFRTLVATTAFGMGIDKPSIRTVVHFLCPASPEAYYQEVGRAGRDGRDSFAIMFFSDEEKDVTDSILSPERTIEEARAEFDAFQARNRFGGGDFIRTFFFHQGNFSGKAEEVARTLKILGEIKKRVTRGEVPIFEFSREERGSGQSRTGPMLEKELEYCLVRLIHLGVIFDYTKDSNAKHFDITVSSEWLKAFDNEDTYRQYFIARYSEYIQRYEIMGTGAGMEGIHAADSPNSIESECCKAMVDYVYDEIERKRRQASRTMLELARKGSRDPEGFRTDLMLYLQASERFTQSLEELARSVRPQSWSDLITNTTGLEELRELHGACQRVLESFPTHPGLLVLSALTRLSPTPDEVGRSVEDLKASLGRWEELFTRNEAISQGHLACQLVRRIDKELAIYLQDSFGHWLIDRDHHMEAGRYLHSSALRIRWSKSISGDLLKLFPKPDGD